MSKTASTTAKKVRQFGEEVVPFKPIALYERWPTCCGAAIMHNNYTTANLFADSNYYANYARKEGRGLLTAIINGAQKSTGADKQLEKAGFELVFTALNPNHGEKTQLYLYAMDLASKQAKDKQLEEKKKKALADATDRARLGSGRTT